MKKNINKWLNFNIALVLVCLTILIQVIRLGFDCGDFITWILMFGIVALICIELHDRKQE